MTVKIGDFGLTTENCVDLESEFDSAEEGLRKSNVGTPLYMAPEISGSKGYSFGIDIYSLGIIYFEMLRPFKTYQQKHE
jgi:serine/threonine protein kinase